MASSANFRVTRLYGLGVHNAKIDFGKLYLRQTFGIGPSPQNQSDVIQTNPVTGLGKIAVNNWEINDGIGLEAKLVAYGACAGGWQNCFTMVFEVERFKGSTLQIMGAYLGKSNEWAIVGGTGDFAMATGVIRRKEHTKTGAEEMQELTIDGYCRMNVPQVPTPTKTVPTPTKEGPWGGNGGDLREMEGKSQRLESVTLCVSNIVEEISFSYINEDGEIRTAGPWGRPSTPPSPETIIKLGPSEFVTGITGETVFEMYLSAFKIVTNVTTYGPFGSMIESPPFSSDVPKDKTVVGFFAHSDKVIHSIGVYTI